MLFCLKKMWCYSLKLLKQRKHCSFFVVVFPLVNMSFKNLAIIVGNTVDTGRKRRQCFPHPETSPLAQLAFSGKFKAHSNMLI